MAHNRRQQRPQRQFQRSPGSFGPPPKRPRTAPPLPPLPPMEWEYDHSCYDRSPRGGRYPPPMYDEYERMPDYGPRAPRRDFSFHGGDEEFYGEYRGDRRGPPRRQQQQQQQHQKGFRQDRNQYPYRPQQQMRGGNRNQRGGQQQVMDQWNEGRRRPRNQKGGTGMGGGRGNGRKSPGRFDDKESSMDRNGTGLQRNWTKTYWAGKGDSPTKRIEEKRPVVEIPEETRFYILCSIIKSKFRLASGVCETFDYFLKENVSKMAPVFTFKRTDGRTYCKFYLGTVCISEGVAITRSDAKKDACEAAVVVMESEAPESILANHDRVDLSKLTDSEDVDAVDYALLSHLERFTGEKPLNNFVILQTEVWSTDDNKANWTSVLVQSAAFSRMELHFQLKGQDHKRVICNIHIDGKFIFSGRGRLVKEAKNFAAKGAVTKLDKTCYTLVLKKRTVLVKDGAKNEDHKIVEETSILESTGRMSEGLDEEEFKANVTDFLRSYVEEDDVTKPLVLSTEGMTKEEREIIIEISKSMQLVQRNEKQKREEPYTNKKGEKKFDDEKQTEEEKLEKKEEGEEKGEGKEEDKKEGEELKTEPEGVAVEEHEIEKVEEEKVNDEGVEAQKEEGSEAVATEENEAEKEGDAEKTEEKEEDKEEEEEEKKDVRPIVLIRKYSGIDMLDYVLNRGNETWKYKALTPGTRQRQAEAEAAALAAAQAVAEAEAKAEAEENEAKEAEAVDGNHEGGAENNEADADAVEEEEMDGQEPGLKEAVEDEAVEEGVEAEEEEDEEEAAE